MAAAMGASGGAIAGCIGRRDCWVRRAARSLSTAGHRRPCLDGGKPGGQCASISAMHLPHHKP
ncbi:MAG: hypothetical protein EBT36_02665 [Betaproteobacteria bacterium]|nr:hypothetical protein [Betaproteobacteria bacterium]NBT70315.1 hypothetical protein [Betaproteobacteria bacterium]NBY55218.1 hypothetical protein [Betaproteobacteria bacterium]NCW81369.1 hypothetical protein [Betaproteobacteria bacterium]NCY07107.1 hypothetical protein [Betaproteobacteria bacterium]